jgi:pimeloyl-ACP methyl ester carboxylesterase
MTITTDTLEHAGARLVYDVRGPIPTEDGRPVLLMIGQPMDASGFRALREQLPERTVVTYDPRGLGRSTRDDGRTDHDPAVQAEDVHAIIAALGVAPVDLFASSGGAVTALALVQAHPHDVATLVAHEPPLMQLLPDAEAAARASAAGDAAYARGGFGAGMAEFNKLMMWEGEFTDANFALPPADPAAFGLPTEDDGSRDDPLLSDASAAVTAWRPDVAAIAAAPTRVVIAVGEESRKVVTGRAAIATAETLGLEPVMFPSHHGGFLDGEFGWPGQPEAFAARLREVLAPSEVASR